MGEYELIDYGIKKKALSGNEIRVAVPVAVIFGKSAYVPVKGNIKRLGGFPQNRQKFLLAGEILKKRKPIVNYDDFYGLNPGKLKRIYEDKLIGYATREDKNIFSALAKKSIWVLKEGWLRVRFVVTYKGINIESIRNVRSITRAERMFRHIIGNYIGYKHYPKGEMQKLWIAKNGLSEAKNVLRQWAFLSKEEKKEKAALFDRVLTRIFMNICVNARNDYLSAIRPIILEAAVMEDSTGRRNPAIAAAKAFESEYLIDKRILDIKNKYPYSVMRLENIRFFIKYLEDNRKLAVSLIDLIAAKILDKEVDPNKKNIKKQIAQKINQAIYCVYRFWVLPYYSVHGIANQELLGAREAFYKNDAKKGLRHLLRARYILENEIVKD